MKIYNYKFYKNNIGKEDGLIVTAEAKYYKFHADIKMFERHEIYKGNEISRNECEITYAKGKQLYLQRIGCGYSMDHFYNCIVKNNRQKSNDYYEDFLISCVHYVYEDYRK